jgi:SnoaL-like polyketide cyclase
LSASGGTPDASERNKAVARAVFERLTITGMTIDRFEDGKIREAWRNIDVLSLYQQIGALGTPLS